jgi:hypothetical protein
MAQLAALRSAIALFNIGSADEWKCHRFQLAEMALN